MKILSSFISNERITSHFSFGGGRLLGSPRILFVLALPFFTGRLRIMFVRLTSLHGGDLTTQTSSSSNSFFTLLVRHLRPACFRTPQLNQIRSELTFHRFHLLVTTFVELKDKFKIVNFKRQLVFKTS